MPVIAGIALDPFTLPFIFTVRVFTILVFIVLLLFIGGTALEEKILATVVLTEMAVVILSSHIRASRDIDVNFLGHNNRRAAVVVCIRALRPGISNRRSA